MNTITPLHKYLVCCSIAFTACYPLAAQNYAYSPYSRFGLGIIEVQGSIPQRSMGATFSALSDLYSINFHNPASYSSLLRTNFQLGVAGSAIRLSTDAQSASIHNVQAHELGLVFKKQGSPWAFALGVTPYSNSSYQLTTADSLAQIGKVEYQYNGNGGLNKALVGLSRNFKLGAARDSSAAGRATDYTMHRLYLGANLNYYFGSLIHQRKVVFDNVTYDHTRITTNTSVHDFGADAGLMYMVPLAAVVENGKLAGSTVLRAGVTWSLNAAMNARFNEFTETFYFLSGVEIASDTLYNFSEKGTITLPQRITAGLSLVRTFRNGGSLLLAADYRLQDWTKFSYTTGDIVSGDRLSKAYGMSFGMEWNPVGAEKSTRFMQRNFYRVGFRNDNTYLVLRDTAISEWGISAGLSMPLIASRSASKLNLAVEYGNGGTTQSGLVKEQTMRYWLGFSFSPFIANDWFIQRKYD